MRDRAEAVEPIALDTTRLAAFVTFQWRNYNEASPGIAANRRASGSFQALIRISAWNVSDMQGWFQLVLGSRVEPDPPTCRGFPKKRLMGFEPTTFCMASRRSSQLSYSRAMADSIWPALKSGGASLYLILT